MVCAHFSIFSWFSRFSSSRISHFHQNSLPHFFRSKQNRKVMASQAQGDNKEKKRKESILDLSKYLEKNIRVKFAGGREAYGILKGYDPLLNLVLDSTTEFLRDPDDPYKLTEDTRQLGLVVCRGTAVVLICPMDGMESIPNPFVQQDG